MIEKLQDFLTEDQLNELIQAVANNKDYKLQGKDFDIDVKSTDNSLVFKVNYKEDLVQDFRDFLSKMDDDLFVAVTEQLGSKKLQQIEDCLNSENPKSIKEGIGMFKMEYRKYLNSRINFYQTCLASLDK